MDEQKIRQFAGSIKWTRMHADNADISPREDPRRSASNSFNHPRLTRYVYALEVNVTLPDFSPGELAVIRTWPGLAVDCTIARHNPLKAFLRLPLKSS